MAIREYIFFCQKCSYQFSEYLDWNDISNYKAKCAMCKNSKDVIRDFSSEKVEVDPGPKTVGGLADKNAKEGLKNDREKEEQNQEASYKIEKTGRQKGRAKRIKKD